MPRQPTITEIRLNNISTCVAITANTVDVLATTLNISGLEAMLNTTQSLLKLVQTHSLLNAIIGVYVKSDTGVELPPNILNEIANFTQTLHKIHTFVEAQQSGSKVKKFFRQGELSELLKDCKAGVQRGHRFFQIKSSDIIYTAKEMEEQAQIRHQEVLNIMETMSSSDSASSISKIYSGSYASSNSISMLPAKPKIFHGRESELADILKHFSQGTPRIAILGAGGMGKTSLAGAVLHHEEVITKYQGNRLFVACGTVSSKVELASLIGVYLGMKPGKDLTHTILHHFSEGPPTLLILDNLETVWEPVKSRKEVEEFLSLLTDITSLALMSKITMRGTERPAKVQWTRPFLLPLEPLSQEAAQKMFIDIADDKHSMDQVNQVLGLTDNMPLSINLLAHLVDAEGCTEILLRWQREQTLVISEGHDQRSNLELSILLSLASSRITSTPHSQELLSLLSILPDGLSDTELKQSNFAIQDILDCKRALLRTALAYTDDHKWLKTLVPIREYMKKFLPPTDEMIRLLLKHFQELLKLFMLDGGKQSAALCIERLTLNYTNILNIIQNGLRPGHPDLADHRVKAYFATRLFDSLSSHLISHPETMIAQTLEHFKTFDDPDLKSDFYTALGYYYSSKLNSPAALQYCQMGLSLAKSHGNIRWQSAALLRLSFIKYSTGDHIIAQSYAQEMQRLASISGNLQGEARGLYSEVLCCQALGNYRECIFLIMRASALLGLCGLSQGVTNYDLMICQADIHVLKSEYDDARTIYQQFLQNYQGTRLYEGVTLINIAEIEILIGISCNVIQERINASHAIFVKAGQKKGLTFCDTIQADLNLREGDMSSFLFCKCLRIGWGNHLDVVSYCLERLVDVTHWDAHHDPSWSAVFLVHSLKAKEKLGIHKALQFIGNVYLMENNEVTAVNLFTIVLEGFTYMDVHRSRAECMIRLGDIAKKNGDVLKALELWETASPLFECSLQAKRVQEIEQRISGISEEIKELHQRNLAHLAELNAPVGAVEAVDKHSSDVEELELEEEQVELITA
ncbi:hypothetical protein B0H16DRAFT_1777129 [Mycena metata]|uniref:Novel STAND NTPase 1 domain-containing protein n=1 Tax=Mycena metata TaxID=1033252 RepID=A0AAD7JQV7_9AGAR|nr:hypothetical protein B0H16DRAFT_1777129 [Mycena metata]